MISLFGKCLFPIGFFQKRSISKIKLGKSLKMRQPAASTAAKKSSVHAIDQICKWFGFVVHSMASMQRQTIGYA